VKPKVTLESIVDMDYGKVESIITEFIKGQVEGAGAQGVVVGVSGGVDSATTLALSVKALGAERVIALIMPDSTVTPQSDVEDAKSLAEKFGVKYHVIDIGPVVDVYKSAIPVYEGEEKDRVPVGNLRARIRMTLLYYYANKFNLLVAGTGDRSEILIGYFTKYGDGAVDFLPIGVLFKSQVRRLAIHLGVPERIAFKPSSPRLWRGHEAEKELGISYEEIDVILHAIFDLGMSVDEAIEATGLERWKVERVIEMHRKSEHKRSPPPTPPLDEVRRLYMR